MGAELPPPPYPPPSAPLSTHRRRRWTRSIGVLAWVFGVAVCLFVTAGVIIFIAGEDLFGSDPDTIDSYNREVLDSCELPASSTLVQTSIRTVSDSSGNRFRSMWYVYASPLPADDVASFFGVVGDVSRTIPADRACKFAQRPSVLVLSESAAGNREMNDKLPVSISKDGLWADKSSSAVINSISPPETQSFFRLRLAQPEVSGALNP